MSLKNKKIIFFMNNNKKLLILNLKLQIYHYLMKINQFKSKGKKIKQILTRKFIFKKKNFKSKLINQNKI
jgi:hypothetical protein